MIVSGGGLGSEVGRKEDADVSNNLANVAAAAANKIREPRWDDEAAADTMTQNAEDTVSFNSGQVQD